MADPKSTTQSTPAPVQGTLTCERVSPGPSTTNVLTHGNFITYRNCPSRITVADAIDIRKRPPREAKKLKIQNESPVLAYSKLN